MTSGLKDLAKIADAAVALAAVVFADVVFLEALLYKSDVAQKPALKVIPTNDGPPPAPDIKVYYFCHTRPLTVARCAVFRVRRDQSSSHQCKW